MEKLLSAQAAVESGRVLVSFCYEAQERSEFLSKDREAGFFHSTFFMKFQFKTRTENSLQQYYFPLIVALIFFSR